MKSKIAIVLVIVMTVYACKHEPFDPPKEEETPVVTLTPCDPDSSYFYNDVVPILVNSCAFATCHSAISLSDYDDIVNIGDVVPGDTSKSYLYQVITSNNPNIRMPRPPGELSNTEIAVIAKWILQGAKPNACDDCDLSEFKFNANVLPIIVKNCKGCHGETNPSGGIKLTKYVEIKAQADSGTLLGALKHSSGFSSMPPSGKMPSCQITVIEKWINNGKPND